MRQTPDYLPVFDSHYPGAKARGFTSEIDCAIRTNRWKRAISAARKTAGGKEEKSSDHYVERYLYDLRRDLYEQVNPAGRPEYRAPLRPN